MRSVVPCWVALALALGAMPMDLYSKSRPAESAPSRDWMRLAEWAASNDLQVSWMKREETLQLSNADWKILLTIDSCQVQINGVSVWLSFPVAYRNGAVYLSQVDVQTTLRPLLSPSASRSGPKVRTICLDPGHGGKDSGNRIGWKQEKKYTLLLAQELRQQLTRAGFKVTLTRSSDSFVDLPVRPDLARQRNADLFVSLHFNAAENSRDSVQGSEVYCITPSGAESTNGHGEGGRTSWCVGNRCNDKSLFLAFQVQKALTRKLAIEDRGVRRARFAVLRDASMPAVLVEAGFMSHPQEGRKIFDPTYRRQIARAITDAVLAYKRQIEPTENVQASRR